MPVTPTYPGVYIEEIPSGVRTITGVATSITAFVGRTLRGPVDDPITINNFGDYERIFGGLWTDSAMSYAVRDFFGNGGAQAIIVRLYKATAGGTETTPIIPSEKQEEAHAAAVVVADATQGSFTSKKSLIDAVNTANNTFLDMDESEKHKFKAHQIEAAESVADAVLAVYTKTGDEGSVEKMKQAAVDAAKALKPKTEIITTISGTAKATITLKCGDKELTLEAAHQGSWGNGLEVLVTLPVPTAADGGGASDPAVFNLYITDTIAGNTESFLNVSVADGPLRVDGVLKNQSALMRVEGSVLPGTIPDVTLDAEDESAPVAVLAVDEASDGAELDYDEFITGKKVGKEGLYALDKADLFNLLCIPPHTVSGEISGSLIADAANYAEDRRAFFIVDPPTTWHNKGDVKDAMETGSLGTSKNAAVFFPRLRKPDPLRDNQLRDFVPCGAVAGVIARTDSTRGIWKAPAGLAASLKGVPALSVPLTDAENGELNPLGVNCLRAMGPAGRVIWGSRSLQGNDQLASEWKYLSVRRVALYIEESLYRGTHWAVFEPNDEPLWSQIRLNLGAFMHNMFRQGAFQGSAPKDAYFVKCDGETTTQNDINLGIVNILVGFAPLKPAEFVIIKLQQMAGQVES